MAKDRGSGEEPKASGKKREGGFVPPVLGKAGGPEAITDLPDANVKGSDRKLRAEIDTKRQLEREKLDMDSKSLGVSEGASPDISPNYVAVGGPEAITDLPKTDFKGARKQLKAEVQEYKDKKKHGDAPTLKVRDANKQLKEERREAKEKKKGK